MRPEDAQRLGVVEGQVAVAVGDEEGLVQQRQRGAERSGGAEERRPLLGPDDASAEARAVAHVGADLLAEVRDAHHDVSQARRDEALELPVDEGTPGDRRASTWER